MKLSTASGSLDATFGVELVGSETTATFDSRSGKKGTPSARNIDYALGLEVLLERLAALGVTVSRITLHPANRREGSQLEPEGFAFPLALASVTTPRRLGLALSRAQERSDRAPGATGTGNGTKRIRLYLELPGPVAPEVLAQQLATGQGIVPVAAYSLVVNDVLEAVVVAGQMPGSSGGARSGRAGESQGFGLTGPERRAVERRAMNVVIKHYTDEGWAVKDVGDDESYDLVCRKHGVELHVEVKGTTGLGEQIILTRNEVDHARMYPHVALAILSSIKLTKGVPPVADGGHLKVTSPWVIDEGELEAMAFYYEPTPAKSRRQH